MQKSRFLKSLSWLVLLNLLIKPVWIFAIDRQVQNSNGAQAYGSYFSLVNLTYVLLFIADAGLSNMLTQRMAAKQATSLTQLMQLKLVLLFIYACSCCFIAWLTHVSQWTILFYAIVIQALGSLFVFLRGLLTAHQYFTTDAWFSVLDKALLIILCSGFIYGSLGQLSLLRFVQLQTATTLFAVLSLSILLVRRRAFTDAEKQSTTTIIRWTAPFAFIILLMSAHYKLDAFLLERLHPSGAVQAGIYAGAFRLLDAANMLGYLTASFLVPFIARHKNNQFIIQPVIDIVRHALLLAGIGLACFAVQFAPWLQGILYHNKDVESIRVLQLCLYALPAYYLIHIYGAALTAIRSFRLFIVIIALSLFVNIILNLWLIPLQGAAGCCIAALISQYSCGLALYFFATRKLHLTHSFLSLPLYIISAGVLLTVFYFSGGAMSHVWVILAAVVALLLATVLWQRQRLQKLISLFSK